LALSDKEIRDLLDKAEGFIAAWNKVNFDEPQYLQRALDCYNRIIEHAPIHPQYFKRRSWILRMAGNFDAAIHDMDKAVELNPHDADSYWERGACYAHKLSNLKNINKNEKKVSLDRILKEYKRSVEKNPINPEAWLAILETDMLLHDWDNAIGHYGDCKPYINYREHQLVRSWLGCLSLVFADDPLEEEDKDPLYDNSIRLRRTHWCVSEIDSLLIELAAEGFDKYKMDMAKEIHQRFLDHFSEAPIRFKVQSHDNV